MEKGLTGKLCFLKEWNESHLEILYKWRNSKEYLEFCSLRKTSNSFDDFLNEFLRDLDTDRQDQFIIFKKSTGKPIGTIFLYGLNTFHQNAFITTFVEDSVRDKGYGVEAFSLFCMFVFEKYNLHKVIADVYSNNVAVPKMLKKCGFIEEGCFREHRKNHSGEWLDVIRLSIFVKDTVILSRFVKNITSN